MVPRALAILSLSLPVVLPACAARPVPWRGATPQTWPVLRRALANERAARPVSPWTAGVRVAVRDPGSGQVVRGRGGMAIAPGRALRMILVGVAGVTMFDAWVTPESWRVAVPPLGIVRRGGAGEPDDVPVGFLRWWLCRPMSGTLFAATFDGESPIWLLRDGGAVVEVRADRCDRGPRLRVSRRTAARAESIEECAAGSRASVGDRVRYRDETSGLAMDLTLESVSGEPPPAEAFRDPDAAGEP